MSMFDVHEKVIREDLLRVRNAFPPEAASRNWSRATHCVVTFVDHDNVETEAVLSQRSDYPGDGNLKEIFPKAIIQKSLWENLFDYDRGLLPWILANAVVYMKEIRLEFYDGPFHKIGEFSMRPSDVVEF